MSCSWGVITHDIHLPRVLAYHGWKYVVTSHSWAILQRAPKPCFSYIAPNIPLLRWSLPTLTGTTCEMMWQAIALWVACYSHSMYFASTCSVPLSPFSLSKRTVFYIFIMFVTFFFVSNPPRPPLFAVRKLHNSPLTPAICDVFFFCKKNLIPNMIYWISTYISDFIVVWAVNLLYFSTMCYDYLSFYLII